MVKVGVLISGCGYLDGAEIQEAVLTALYLEQEGAEVAWAASGPLHPPPWGRKPPRRRENRRGRRSSLRRAPVWW